MKRYQSRLPGATAFKPLHPRQERELELSIREHNQAREMKLNLQAVLHAGFWYCNSCDSRTERIEGEQGQPAHCQTCGSHRIQFLPPLKPALQEVA